MWRFHPDWPHDDSMIQVKVWEHGGCSEQEKAVRERALRWEGNAVGNVATKALSVAPDILCVGTSSSAGDEIRVDKRGAARPVKAKKKPRASSSKPAKHEMRVSAMKTAKTLLEYVGHAQEGASKLRTLGFMEGLVTRVESMEKRLYEHHARMTAAMYVDGADHEPLWEETLKTVADGHSLVSEFDKLFDTMERVLGKRALKRSKAKAAAA